MNKKQVIFPENSKKEEVLLMLWKSASYVGMGYLYAGEQPTIDDARSYLESMDYVDYFFGKPIKTSFADFPELDPYLYNRDEGCGAMQKVANEKASPGGNFSTYLKKQATN